MPSANQNAESSENTTTLPAMTCYRDLQSTIAYGWPYSEAAAAAASASTSIHYRLQPLAINPTFLHFAQREAITRAFLSLYDQRAFLENYKPSAYPSSDREEEKPKQSYVRLIGEAILNSPEKKLVLSEIYKNIQTKYPYFKNRGSGWKNSIRHNLSLNDCFVKLGRSPNGKGHFWTLSPQHYEEFLRGSSHQRKFQKKSAPKYCYYPSDMIQFNNYTAIDNCQAERITTQTHPYSQWSVNRTERISSSYVQSGITDSPQSYDSNETPESPHSYESISPVNERKTVIHIPGDEIEVKQEIIVCTEEDIERPIAKRPFDVENLLASEPKRPASY